MVESNNERTLAKGAQSAEDARNRLSSDFSRSEDDLDLMREFHVGAPSVSNVESLASEPRAISKEKMSQGGETFKRISQDESALVAQGILPNSKMENYKSFAEPVVAKNILKDSSSSLISQKRSYDFEPSESFKSKMANSIPLAKEVEYRNDYALGTKLTERDLQAIPFAKQLGAKDDFQNALLNKEAVAQQYEGKTASNSLALRDVSGIGPGQSKDLSDLKSQIGQALKNNDTDRIQMGQPLGSRDVNAIQMGQPVGSKEVYKELRANVALDSAPTDRSFINSMDKPNRESQLNPQVGQRVLESNVPGDLTTTKASAGQAQKGSAELTSFDGTSAKSDFPSSSSSSSSRTSLDPRTPTEARVPTAEPRAPTTEPRIPTAETRPQNEPRIAAEMRTPGESSNRPVLADSFGKTKSDVTTAPARSGPSRESPGESVGQPRLAPKSQTESVGRDTAVQSTKDATLSRSADQVSPNNKTSGTELSAVLLQQKTNQDAASAKMPSVLLGGITIETGIRRPSNEASARPVTDASVRTSAEGVMVRTATDGAVRVATESAARIATDGAVRTTTDGVVRTTTDAAVRTTTDGVVRTTTDAAVRTTTDAAVRTATDAAVRTATDGVVRTTTDGAVRTAIDGAVRTTIDGAARTTTDGAARTATDGAARTATDGAARTATDGARGLTDIGAGRPLADGVVRPGEARPTIDGLSVRPTADGASRSERIIGQPNRRGIEPSDSANKRFVTGAELAAFLAIAGIAKARTNPDANTSKTARDLVISTIDSGRLNSLRGVSLSAWLAICSAENSQASVQRTVDKIPGHEERLEHDMTAPTWFVNARKKVLDNQSSGTEPTSPVTVPLIPELIIVEDAVSGKLERRFTDEFLGDNDRDTSVQSETSPQALYRPTHLISRSESLVSIAEKYFDDARLGWLIADLNAEKLKETWFEGKRVVEIRSREKLELPVEEDILRFYGEKLPPQAEKLITIVIEGEIDKEVVSETFKNVFANGTGMQ